MRKEFKKIEEKRCIFKVLKIKKIDKILSKNVKSAYFSRKLKKNIIMTNDKGLLDHCFVIDAKLVVNPYNIC